MDNAFERARAAYGTGAYDDATLEFLFPQLKESEDERIRKWIYNLVSNMDPKDDDAEKELDEMKPLALAWLEKQKDLDKMIVVSPEVWDKAINDAFENGKKEQKEQNPALSREETLHQLFQNGSIKFSDYLCLNGEHKPAEWSEDWREEDIQTRFAFYTYKDEDGVLYLSNVFVEETSRNHGFGTRILRAAEKVAETIGATTISLKVKQDSPANAWYRKNGYGYVAFEDGYDWLEKNLEYMKPNKQEWSEEDTEMYINVASSLRGYACGLENKEHRKHIKKGLDWLENRFKSLCPQPKEEWSEEDEEKLERAIHIIVEYSDIDEKESEIVQNWLKSLRPQPKVEWSEEDSKRYVSIRTTLETSAVLSKEDYDANIVWLRDLVNVIKYSGPKPSWKPSEEQMKALQNAVALAAGNKVLAELYEQLKQL